MWAIQSRRGTGHSKLQDEEPCTLVLTFADCDKERAYRYLLGCSKPESSTICDNEENFMLGLKHR